MANSRNKGASFERQIAKELLLLTGLDFSRNLEQVRALDQCDLICEDPAWPFSLELKRYAKGCDPLKSWIDQTVKAAAKTGKIPCLIFKFDRMPIRCTVPMVAIGEALGQLWQTDEWATITIEGFAYLAREIMARRAA